MSQAKTINRQIQLAARPHGAPVNSDFNLVESELPTIKSGEVLLRTVYLSLDPYMRGRMSASESYAAPLEIGETILGGTVSRVEASENANFKVGDWVLSFNGWQDYAVSNGI